jgi:hypothetical protein
VGCVDTSVSAAGVALPAGVVVGVHSAFAAVFALTRALTGALACVVGFLVDCAITLTDGKKYARTKDPNTTAVKRLIGPLR